MAVETIRQGDLLSAQSSRKLVRALNTFANLQSVAASAVGENAHHVTAAPSTGQVSFKVYVQDDVFGGGESMTFAVSATKPDGTVVALTSAFTVDSTNAGAVPVVLDGAAAVDATKEVEVGDVLTVERVYTAGATPTPATTTIAVVQVE